MRSANRCSLHRTADAEKGAADSREASQVADAQGSVENPESASNCIPRTGALPHPWWPKGAVSQAPPVSRRHIPNRPPQLSRNGSSRLWRKCVWRHGIFPYQTVAHFTSLLGPFCLRVQSYDHGGSLVYLFANHRNIVVQRQAG